MIHAYAIRTVLLTVAVALGTIAEAQKTINDLAPNERAALSSYLKKNPQYELATEDRFDKVTFKDLKRELKGFRHPYYAAADFNRDRRMDFAVVVVKKGDLHNLEDFNASKLLIYNGTRHGYKLAYSEARHFEDGTYVFFGHRT